MKRSASSPQTGVDLSRVNLGSRSDSKSLGDFAVREIFDIEKLDLHYKRDGKVLTEVTLSVRTTNELKRCNYFPPYWYRGIYVKTN